MRQRSSSEFPPRHNWERASRAGASVQESERNQLRPLKKGKPGDLIRKLRKGRVGLQSKTESGSEATSNKSLGMGGEKT